MEIYKFLKNLLIGLTLAVALISCSASHDSALGLGSGDLFILNPNPDPVLRSNAQSVLTNRCFSCHGPSGLNSPIFEDAGGSVDMDALITNTRYVAIGDPESSFLYQAIFSVNMPAAPPSQTFINSTSEQRDIELWLEDIGILDTSGGGTGGGGGSGSAGTFSQVEAQVLTPLCYSCHATQFPVFTDFNSVRATIVLPNNPNSAFLRVIQSTDDMERMPPPPQQALSPTLINLVESWVLDGAQNN